MTNGCNLIVKERARQVSDENWTPQHDDQHADGDLAMAAACYAAPNLIYHRPFTRDWKGKRCYPINCIEVVDPWPWDERWDKRMVYGANRDSGSNVIPDPETYSDSERLDLLVKAGALIAAEIDKLLRQQSRTDKVLKGGD